MSDTAQPEVRPTALGCEQGSRCWLEVGQSLVCLARRRLDGVEVATGESKLKVGVEVRAVVVVVVVVSSSRGESQGRV
jgi:ABC-type proline/glycine betaine transport system permease subunit